jgi:hypothetical protein
MHDTGRNNVLFLAIALHLLLPLLVGGMVYVAMQPESYPAQWWHQLTGYNIFIPPIQGLRGLAQVLPDFLWSYSLSFFLLWWLAPLVKNVFRLSLGILGLLIVTEWVQVFFPNRFTFDFLDLVAAITAFFLSLFFYKRLQS